MSAVGGGVSSSAWRPSSRGDGAQRGGGGGGGVVVQTGVERTSVRSQGHARSASRSSASASTRASPPSSQPQQQAQMAVSVQSGGGSTAFHPISPTAPRVAPHSAKGPRPSPGAFVPLPPSTLPAPARPASSAAAGTTGASPSRFGGALPSPSAAPQSLPLHALRSATRGFAPGGPLVLQRINSNEDALGLSLSSLGLGGVYPVSPYSDSASDNDGAGGGGAGGAYSHSSSATSLSGYRSGVTPTPFLPQTSNTSPRKRPGTSGQDGATASPVGATSLGALGPPPKTASPALGSMSGGATSPLSQRYGRYGSTAHSPNQQPMSQQQQQQSPQQQQTAQAQSPYSRTLSSNTHASSAVSIKSHGSDLPSPTRSLGLSMAQQHSGGGGKGKPVRAHHLAGSASASNMAAFLAASSTDASSSDADDMQALRDGHQRSHSVFATAQPSHPAYNIWENREHASKAHAATAASASLAGSGGSVQQQRAAARVAPRPSSSHSAQRPITARADLWSARDDAAPPRRSPLGHESGGGGAMQNPYTAHYAYNMHRPSLDEQRTHTAAPDSLGSQARARSAHVVLRPPSRQRPPNQALHLEPSEHPSAAPAAAAFPVSPSAAVRASSATRAAMWASNSSGSQNGPNGRPISGGRGVHPSQRSGSALRAGSGSGSGSVSVGDELFPAPPVELVAAVQQQLRSMTAGGPRNSGAVRTRPDAHTHAHTTRHGAWASHQQQQNRACAGSPPEASVNSCPSSDWEGDSDTESDVEVELDGNGSGSHSSSHTDDREGGAKRVRDPDGGFGLSPAAASRALLVSSSSLSGVGTGGGAGGGGGFVSMHNILQLQSESAIAGKHLARLGSGHGGSSRKQSLPVNYPASSSDASAAPSNSSTRPSTVGRSHVFVPTALDDDPFPMPPQRISSISPARRGGP